MIANPPSNPTENLNHVAIAWPIDLLKDEKGNFKGFLMPAIKDSVELVRVYSPKIRNKERPDFNWKYLYTTAKNIAWIIHHIHQRGYILGDIKPQNILVNNRSLVSIVDTDSFQVTDPRDNTVYRCSVGSEEFTPPELINKELHYLNQTKTHDRFRLAVTIYYLLFGYHPFAPGRWVGPPEEEPQNPNERIIRGLWLYSQNNLIQDTNTKTYTIPLDVVHPKIKEYFLKCFNDGHLNPSLRPSAEDWYEALEIVTKDLITCTKLPENHFYSRTYSLNGNECYWCKRAESLGTDIFLPQASQASIPKTTTTSKTTTSTTTIPKTTTTTTTQPGKSQPGKSQPGKSNGCLMLIIAGAIVVIVIFFVAVAFARSTSSRKESNLHHLTTKVSNFQTKWLLCTTKLSN